MQPQEIFCLRKMTYNIFSAYVHKFHAFLIPFILVVVRGCFSNLKILALNSCCINSFASVQILETILPSIEELYLAANHLVDIPDYHHHQSAPVAEGENNNDVDANQSVASDINKTLSLTSRFSHASQEY